jgi:DNA polymerase-1
MNMFVRHYMANPSQSKNGELIGGVVGYMKALSALVKKHMPEKVYVVWEGGGSPRRRQIFPEYKANRKPAKMNRFYGDLVPDSEDNKNAQIQILIELFKTIPVRQLYVDNCEADDVIGYMCKKIYQDQDKIIVSSDKDFYQLLDDKTKVYRPGKRTFVNKQNVIDEFNIAPKNFCVAKAFCGDSSDNIDGVSRVGFKTLAKRFDMVSEVVTIEHIFEESQKQVSEAKKPLVMYKNIVESEKIVRRNMELMILDDRLLNAGQVHLIHRIVEDFKPKYNKIKFWRKYLDFDLDGLDVDRICDSFHYLIHN